MIKLVIELWELELLCMHVDIMRIFIGFVMLIIVED